MTALHGAAPSTELRRSLPVGRLAGSQRAHAFAISIGTTVLMLACPLVFDLRPLAGELGLAGLLYAGSVLGITVGFHRGASHRAFKAGPIVRALFWILGSMAAQGPLIYWVSNHRRHHQFSDERGDPHSPHVGSDGELVGWSGFCHAHFGWSFQPQLSNPLVYARDLYRDPVALWVNGSYFVWVVLGVVGPGALAWLLTGSAASAGRATYWAFLVRHALSFHATSGINSITHLFGQRPFATTDRSRNNVLLALPTLGEGWHNNHHAFPGSARLGLTWYELDLGWAVLKSLRAIGLVQNLNSPKPTAIARARRANREGGEGGTSLRND